MRYLMITIFLFISSCGYQLRQSPLISKKHPEIFIKTDRQTELKHQLSLVFSSSGVKLAEKDKATQLVILKDSLVKKVQSVGANNQVQEFRLEYDVEFSFDGQPSETLYLERDYSFDIQQIGGGQQEELNLRKQLVEDMAWALIRKINSKIVN